MIRKCTDEDDLLNDDTVIVDVFSKIYFGDITSDKTDAFKVGEELIPPEWIKNKQSYFGLIMPLNLSSDFKPTTYLKDTIEFENFKIIGSVVQVKRYYD